MQEFSLRHPTAYRRLLACLAIGVALTGLGVRAKLIEFRPGQSVGSQSLLVAPLAAVAPPDSPQPVETPVYQLKSMPGRDGSSSPATPAAAAAPTGAAITQTINPTTAGARQLGYVLNAATFGVSQWPALDALWSRESGWNPQSRNRHSQACGIPQALPCSKMTDQSVQGQITWGLSYIQRRYGTPVAALSHQQRYGWY